jgi:hypothetical protein
MDIETLNNLQVIKSAFEIIIENNKYNAIFVFDDNVKIALEALKRIEDKLISLGVILK